MPPARCALWARVSTDEQDTGNQLAQLRAEVGRRGLEVAREYVLDGLSAWTGGHREHLRQALDDARAGRYEVLLVWALDWLEQGRIEQKLRVMRQFRERGVLVVSKQGPWTDAGGEMQELLTAIMAWVARMEPARRSERVRAGEPEAAGERVTYAQPTRYTFTPFDGHARGRVGLFFPGQLPGPDPARSFCDGWGAHAAVAARRKGAQLDAATVARERGGTASERGFAR